MLYMILAGFCGFVIGFCTCAIFACNAEPRMMVRHGKEFDEIRNDLLILRKILNGKEKDDNAGNHVA